MNDISTMQDAAAPASAADADKFSGLPVADAMPRLTYSRDVDVCVLGAGLAGLTIARELALMGQDVVVLEAQHVGWAASGHNGGFVLPGYGVDPHQVVERVGFEDARALWDLAQSGSDYIASLIADHPDAMRGCVPHYGWLQASKVESGDDLIGRLQILGEDFGIDVEGLQREQVRERLRTKHYFHALHYPKAFHIDSAAYLRGLAQLARQAGVVIYENTPAVALDTQGIRKRIVTPGAKLRAAQVVLAGNVHLGAPMRRLSETLLPVWMHGAITAPLGPLAREAIDFAGMVSDTNGVDHHYRVLDDTRLQWMSHATTWAVSADAYKARAKREIETIYPQLRGIEIERVWNSPYGQTVHGMPQIGELRPGVWVASGFGRQGLNTSAMAGVLVSRGIVDRDDRWRLFSPFELVWAGGFAGRVVGQAIYSWSRVRERAAAAMSRRHEQASEREKAREMRVAAANEAARALERRNRAAPPANPGN